MTRTTEPAARCSGGRFWRRNGSNVTVPRSRRLQHAEWHGHDSRSGVDRKAHLIVWMTRVHGDATGSPRDARDVGVEPDTGEHFDPSISDDQSGMTACPRSSTQTPPHRSDLLFLAEVD